jgi:hypothetical protein
MALCIAAVLGAYTARDSGEEGVVFLCVTLLIVGITVFGLGVDKSTREKLYKQAESRGYGEYRLSPERKVVWCWTDPAPGTGENHEQ